MVKIADIFTMAVEFTINTQTKQEVLPFLKVQYNSELVARGGIELGVLELVSFETSSVTATPVFHALGEIIDEAGFWKIVEGSEIDV